MSPEQLKTLQKLSKLFEEGLAGPSQIKQLSELLAIINQRQDEQCLDFSLDIELEPTNKLFL